MTRSTLLSAGPDVNAPIVVVLQLVKGFGLAKHVSHHPHERLADDQPVISA